MIGFRLSDSLCNIYSNLTRLWISFRHNQIWWLKFVLLARLLFSVFVWCYWMNWENDFSFFTYNVWSVVGSLKNLIVKLFNNRIFEMFYLSSAITDKHTHKHIEWDSGKFVEYISNNISFFLYIIYEINCENLASTSSIFAS